MKLFVTVKPGARTESVERISDTELIVKVRAPAQEGKANRAVTEALAAYLGLPKSRVVLQKGATGKKKIFEIE